MKCYKFDESNTKSKVGLYSSGSNIGNIMAGVIYQGPFLKGYKKKRSRIKKEGGPAPAPPILFALYRGVPSIINYFHCNLKSVKGVLLTHLGFFSRCNEYAI